MLENLEQANLSQVTTSSHHLTRVLYGDLDRLHRERLSINIMFSVFIDFAIYVVPVTILSTQIDFSAQCGIPMTRWVVGLLSIILLNNVHKFFMYIVVQRCRGSRFIYGVFGSTLTFTTLFVWLIYGNVMYYSRRNDCMYLRETRVLSYLMLGYLYVGYLQIGYAMSYAYCLPHALMKWWQLRRRSQAFHQ